MTAVQQAVAGDHGPLVEALARNIYAGDAAGLAAAPRLAAYMVKAVRDLKAQDTAAILDGSLHFPEPSAIAAGP